MNTRLKGLAVSTVLLAPQIRYDHVLKRFQVLCGVSLD